MKLIAHIIKGSVGPVVFLFAFVSIARFVEWCALGPEMFYGANFYEAYSLFNTTSFTAFVLCPIYLVLLQKLYLSAFDCLIVVRHGTRLRLMCSACGLILSFSLLFSVEVDIPSVLGLALIGVPSFDMLYLFLSVIAHAVFFFACALVFLSVKLLNTPQFFACLAVLLLGIWDFMAAGVPGGGVPCFAWSRTFLPFSFDPLGVVIQLVPLLVLTACAAVSLLFSIQSADFVLTGSSDII